MNNRLYIDFHIIQTVPPSCVNRDDTGRPKTAVYGGVTRARVSSQSWKRAVRRYFVEHFPQQELGYRTRKIPSLIAEEIIKLNGDITPENATKLAKEALVNAGLSVKDDKKKKGENVLDALFFMSKPQIKALVELAANGEDDKKKYEDAVNDFPSVDIAMFGRMAASMPEANVDACVQVAHSISTHAIQNEYDFFTAVDDCSPEDTAGAGHIGTTEFNSSTLYRYATVNVMDLCKNIPDTAGAVKAFAEALICSMPTGKQNSYANRTLPDIVYITVRKDQPANFAGAFEKPVVTSGGYAELSANALCEYAKDVYSSFISAPDASFVVGRYSFEGAEKLSLSDMLTKLGEYIESALQEVK